MKFTTETNLTHFDFWSGARDRADRLTYRQLERLDDLLPEVMGWNDSNLPTDTQINDLFWFDEDFIANLLGFDTFEELERHNDDEDYCGFPSDDEDENENDSDDENEEE